MKGDQECMRILCYEMLRNHQKYGTGPRLEVQIAERDGAYRLEFASPGTRVKGYDERTDPYAEIGKPGTRFVTYDDKGNVKNPRGRGMGVYFCVTFILAHNGEREAYLGEKRGFIYGVERDEQRGVNIFWYRFPRVEP
jgi:hypothetical protein